MAVSSAAGLVKGYRNGHGIARKQIRAGSACGQAVVVLWGMLHPLIAQRSWRSRARRPVGATMHLFPRMIATTGSHEIVIKKSRFICTIARAATEEEARAVIDDCKKRFWDANHNCSAYRVGENGRFQRSNDDGEPAGTAGTPMLAVLTRRELTDTVAVVTRYFGGTLLGAGGLIRAYGQAVSETVELTGIVERRPLALVEVEATYAEAGRLEHALRTAGYHLGDILHGATVQFQLPLDDDAVPEFERWVADATNGDCTARISGHTFVEVAVPTSD